MSHKSFTYSCIKVQQTPDSIPFYVASVKANELLKWCDVPRSREGFMAGYQRELENRHEKITEFFQQDSQYNIIPNAVIVAVDNSKISIEESQNGIGFSVSLEESDFPSLIQNLIAEFESRLSEEELDSIVVAEYSESEDEVLVDASTPPDSYLAELTKRLRLVRDRSEDLDEEQVKYAKEYVFSVSKPGLILDGQHRVFGAKEVSQFDVEFPVILLPGIEFSEQVFHFYVLNNKAKPLSRTHLRRIISTTLSKKEIGILYNRLNDAGIEAKSAEWTHRMNVDSNSPFKGLIDMGLSESNGAVPENVAYQVVSRFMGMHNRYRLLADKVEEWNPNENDYRLNAFYAVWRAVKEKYPKAWQYASDTTSPLKDRQIFYKVSLIVLQAYILDTLNSDMPRRSSRGEASPFADLGDLELEVGYALAFLKEKFFMQEWKVKGLDTSTGHDLFRKAIDKAIQNESKHLGNMTLFKET